MRAVVVFLLATFAGAMGFYAGAVALLWTLGFSAAQLVPVVALGIGGLLAGLAAGLGWRRTPAAVTMSVVGCGIAGTVAGVAAEYWYADTTWVVLTSLMMVAATVALTRPPANPSPAGGGPHISVARLDDRPSEVGRWRAAGLTCCGSRPVAAQRIHV